MFSPLVGQDALINMTNQRLIFPFYHAVSDVVPLHLKHLYLPRGVQQFKNDLEYLLKYYQPISLSELLKIKSGEKELTKNSFHLTFDDGLSEFYHVVAPILKEYGVPATVFLNTNFIDNKSLFYRFKASILYDQLKDSSILSISYNDRGKLYELAQQNGVDFDAYLKEQRPYLSSQQIKELIGQGFTFGAHSIDHPLFNQLSIEEQMHQTKESIKTVCHQFNIDYKVFSFPFTDDGVEASFFKTIKEEVDVTFGCAGLKKQEFDFHHQRIPMEMKASAQQILKTAYVYYWMKGLIGKNKIKR